MAPIMTEADVILSVVNGSRLYGTATPTSDHDALGVFLAPVAQVLGITDRIDSRVRRNVPAGARSDARTIESTEYELAKFLRLCLGGNPNVVPVLYVPESAVLHTDELGQELLALRAILISRQIATKFAGMTHSQLGRLQGQGHQARMPNRPELLAAHGYDVKYAATAFRTALMGRELIETGTLHLPMTRAEEVLAMRGGSYTLEQAIAATEAELRAMDAALDSSPLPEQPDRTAAEALCIRAYRSILQ